MYKNKTILCIITARKGSKGLANKNILKIGNKPLVCWPIIAAKKSKLIDSIYLSTDSKKIMSIGKKYKLVIRPLREKKLSTSKSSSIDVVISVIKKLNEKKEKYDYVILLEPTSPFTSTIDIDNALRKLINKKNFNSLVSITENITGHPNFNFLINKKQQIKPYQGNKYNSIRRQDLNKLYFLDGSLYVSKTKKLLQNKNFLSNKSLGLTMPKYKSFEIDDYLDLLISRTIYKNINTLKKNEK